MVTVEDDSGDAENDDEYARQLFLARGTQVLFTTDLDDTEAATSHDPMEPDSESEPEMNLIDELDEPFIAPPRPVDRVEGHLPQPGPFVPASHPPFTPHTQSSRGVYLEAPSLADAKNALVDLEQLISPKRAGGKGHKPFPFPGDDILRSRLTMMTMALRNYTGTKSRKRMGWMKATEKAAEDLGKPSKWTVEQLRIWLRSFIEDREELPFNLYGTWSTSMLDDGELAQDLFAHLQSIGLYVRAEDIVEYLSRPEVQAKHNLAQTVSLATAKRWMRLMDYRWTKTPSGQYVDGHEREDVVAYRQAKFLPTLFELLAHAQIWKEGMAEARGNPPERYTIIWYHDESTFYANDRRLVRWVWSKETAKPRPKGEGASLMVADFVSADFGWLASPDGTESARVLFKAGSSRDGYFTNDEILEQAEKAMDILERHYQDYNHVFIFDNATTHQKRADDALSARKMPKFTSKAEKNFMVERTKRNAENKIMYDELTKKPQKEKIRMGDGQFRDGSPQPLYFPPDHPEHPGLFKGMAKILEERGYADAPKLRAECVKFKCSTPFNRNSPCCCRRLLYNEADFENVQSLLEQRCLQRGVIVLFLPKFHPELNPIEQCWGYAKRFYRMYPRSSAEDDLVRNVQKALAEVKLENIRRFTDRSIRYGQLYLEGNLNGKQAA